MSDEKSNAINVIHNFHINDLQYTKRLKFSIYYNNVFLLMLCKLQRDELEEWVNVLYLGFNIRMFFLYIQHIKNDSSNLLLST